jgi:hypothetical protein
VCVRACAQTIIADLYFRSAVLAVRLSRARLVVVQARAVAVYALATLQARAVLCGRAARLRWRDARRVCVSCAEETRCNGAVR